MPVASTSALRLTTPPGTLRRSITSLFQVATDPVLLPTNLPPCTDMFAPETDHAVGLESAVVPSASAKFSTHGAAPVAGSVEAATSADAGERFPAASIAATR